MIKNLNDRLDFHNYLYKQGLSVSPVKIETLWVNITRACNQTCTHCHVDASPERKEYMSRQTIDSCLEVLSENESIRNMDITGGAPELHPHFEYLVHSARRLDKHVMVRHNLTVVIDGNPQTGEKLEKLPGLFAENGVEIIASLPHYREEYVDKQRGPGVYKKSIAALGLLNAVGYGKPNTGLTLNLVHNADGPISPDEKEKLGVEYKDFLKSKFGIDFNNLYTVTNMPVKRFLDGLERSGAYHEYMSRLVDSFNKDAIPELVCRTLISVGIDGRLYDCDFNQSLDLHIFRDEPMTIRNFNYDILLKRKIRFASHCFGCTAGGGSN